MLYIKVRLKDGREVKVQGKKIDGILYPHISWTSTNKDLFKLRMDVPLICYMITKDKRIINLDQFLEVLSLV